MGIVFTALVSVVFLLIVVFIIPEHWWCKIGWRTPNGAYSIMDTGNDDDWMTTCKHCDARYKSPKRPWMYMRIK